MPRETWALLNLECPAHRSQLRYSLELSYFHPQIRVFLLQSALKATSVLWILANAWGDSSHLISFQEPEIRVLPRVFLQGAVGESGREACGERKIRVCYQPRVTVVPRMRGCLFHVSTVRTWTEKGKVCSSISSGNRHVALRGCSRDLEGS